MKVISAQPWEAPGLQAIAEQPSSRPESFWKEARTTWQEVKSLFPCNLGDIDSSRGRSLWGQGLVPYSLQFHCHNQLFPTVFNTTGFLRTLFPKEYYAKNTLKSLRHFLVHSCFPVCTGRRPWRPPPRFTPYCLNCSACIKAMAGAEQIQSSVPLTESFIRSVMSITDKIFLSIFTSLGQLRNIHA